MQFTPLWRSCEARIGLFMCRDRTRDQFSPLLKSCEARIGLFMSRERSRKQLSPLCGPVKLV